MAGFIFGSRRLSEKRVFEDPFPEQPVLLHFYRWLNDGTSGANLVLDLAHAQKNSIRLKPFGQILSLDLNSATPGYLMARLNKANIVDLNTEMVAAHFRSSCDTLQRAAADPDFCTTVVTIADTITDVFRTGGKVLIAGNGGSAGDAQHIAGEFLSRLNFDRNPLPAIALTTDTSVLTAVGNDYGFDKVFERQVRGLGRPR
jgi:hypothetical protein